MSVPVKNRKIFYLATLTSSFVNFNYSSWILQAKILYMLQKLKTKFEVWYGICCFHAFIWQTSFLVFHFIFELLSIFMVMRNIVKIEWIITTENCLANIFSVGNIFTNWIIQYLSQSYVAKSRGMYTKWTNILCNILSNEWKLKFVYQQNFPLRKH